MAKQCLFCLKTVDSAEHIWSDWILEDLQLYTPIRIRIGRKTDRWKDNPEMLVNCVCQRRNNEWMSDLENENKPHMRLMMNDKSVILEPEQQKLLARWAVLKAIVIEATNRHRPPFYEERERKGLVPPSPFLPVGTAVWLGRIPMKGFHAGGTDIWRAINKIANALRGCVTTIIVGHLVFQALTVHVLPVFVSCRIVPECEPGTWDSKLLDIWPIFGTHRWPPPVSFARKGIDSIGWLILRYSLGENIG